MHSGRDQRRSEAIRGHLRPSSAICDMSCWHCQQRSAGTQAIACRGKQALKPLHAEGSRHSGHCMQREAGTQAIACRGQQALRPLHANIVPAGRAAQLPTGRASPDEGGHQRVISGNQMVPQLPTRRASPCAAASRAARPTPTVARSQSPAIPRNLPRRQTPFRASKALC